MKLDLSKSPRATWVWANDVEECVQVRTILNDAGCTAWSVTGENGDPRALNIDIGVVAMEGLLVLKKAGYAFRWHPDQSELDRGPELFGIPVDEERQN